MTELHHPSRRLFLRHATRIALAGSVLAIAPKSFAISQKSRSLAFSHTHTGENLALTYATNGQYLPESLDTLNHFLRDHYTGEVGNIDPELFDLLYQLRLVLRSDQPFQVISGYRDPGTNELLRNSRGGGVAKRSLHMDGKAIDIRLPGIPLEGLRNAALSLRVGGVGYYPREQFVHLDTGRVRSW